jgi:hypothetical protein
MRVLHAPVNIGNQPWILSRYERLLGVESDLVLNYNTWINYKSDRVLGTYANANIKEVLKRAPFGFLAPFKYDVLHCYFGRSLLFWDDLGSWNRFPYADMKIAKALGKKIFMTLQGCDIRLAGESNRRNHYTPCAPGRCTAFETCISTYDAQRRKMIAEVSPLCDRVFYLNPELGHFVPNGTFMPYASAEIENVEVAPPNIDRPPRIVHAPSDGNIKGTRLIIEALDALRSELEFEFILVQNKTHAEAMELYRNADLAIDQVLAGWYGGFAVEMMAMGKPVMCWIREEDMRFVPESLRNDIPLLNIRPDHLVEDIGNILTTRTHLLEWSRASREYVLKWHNPRRIAALLVEMYKDPSNRFNLELLAKDEEPVTFESDSISFPR